MSRQRHSNVTEKSQQRYRKVTATSQFSAPGESVTNPSNSSRERDGFGLRTVAGGVRRGESVESITNPSRAAVTDLEGCKARNNNNIHTLSPNTSRCHAHPRARRVRTCEGGVTDSRDGFGPGRPVHKAGLTKLTSDVSSVRQAARAAERTCGNRARSRSNTYSRIGTWRPPARLDRGGNGRQPPFCLFGAKTRPLGPRGDAGHRVGQPYASGGPDATGANPPEAGRLWAAGGEKKRWPDGGTSGHRVGHAGRSRVASNLVPHGGREVN